MLIHGLLIEGVYLRRLSGTFGANDFLSDCFDGFQFVPGEKKFGALTRKGACDSAANRASGSVNYNILVLIIFLLQK